MDNVNYKIAKSVARRIKRSGYGLTGPQIAYYQAICGRIELDELTQVVAVAHYRAEKESKNFYSVLTNELAHLGVFKNQKKYNGGFVTTDWREDVQVKQLKNLYSAIGFKLFYRFMDHGLPKSTLQKLLWKSFAKRKNEERIKKADRQQIESILMAGGWVRFSKTSSSCYIENNETTIRIADHSEDGREDFGKTLISC